MKVLGLIWALGVAAPDGAGAIDVYLATEFPPADGFSSGKKGPGRVAIGHGRVRRIEATDDGFSVAIEHLYYENLEQKRVVSTTQGLEAVAVTEGALVTRGQWLGRAKTKAQVVLQILPEQDGLPGTARQLQAFLKGRGQLFVPQSEVVLWVVDQERYELRRYHRGALVDRLEIGLGQAKGAKVRQGDLRTPKGMYFVIDKHRGQFSGRYGAYFGGHWIKINYPNPWDAARGQATGLIDAGIAERIGRAWAERRATHEGTPLGGGIGFHGWNGEWSGEGGAHLSWGCVVLHNPDISRVWDEIPIGAMVVIL
ncbi:MAG: L,D-transpeptidase [Deltaproteobacteria bacterium]|nr:L,D-transpeptidase [Deltaproteobacteria bacterium]